MTRKLFALVAVALVSLSAAAAPVSAKHGDDKGTKLEGRVLSVNRTAHTFRLRDNEFGTATIVVTRSTEFQGIRFSQVRPGKRLEVRFHLVNGRRVATKIEHRSSSHN